MRAILRIATRAHDAHSAPVEQELRVGPHAANVATSQSGNYQKVLILARKTARWARKNPNPTRAWKLAKGAPTRSFRRMAVCAFRGGDRAWRPLARQENPSISTLRIQCSLYCGLRVRSLDWPYRWQVYHGAGFAPRSGFRPAGDGRRSGGTKQMVCAGHEAVVLGKGKGT